MVVPVGCDTFIYGCCILFLRILRFPRRSLVLFTGYRKVIALKIVIEELRNVMEGLCKGTFLSVALDEQ